MKNRKRHQQDSRYSSPWGWKYRLKILLWEYSWTLLCRWTPKPCNPWRLVILRLFGTKIYGRPFVHQHCYIDHPWNLILHDRACLGNQAHAYCLGIVEIREAACVAQEAYLCTGTHDFSNPIWPLETAPIEIGAGAFIGARAFVMPGIKIGERAVIGACSVVTKDVARESVVKGNPARAHSQTRN
jgi:putative colanic acid biosynthesis acetyltransferase WcaF